MLDNFIDFISAQKRFSQHTAIAYKKDLEQFFEFAEISEVQELKEVNARLVRGWMVDLMENEYVAQSVNRKLSTLRTYFKWLKREGLVTENPMKLVRGPKNNKRLPSFIQQKQITESKLSDTFSDDFDGLRDKLMFELLYQTGIRLSELINLKDSDASNSQIKVLGKRNKERIIPISKDLSQLIQKYRGERREISISSDSLLVLKTGKILYPKFVYRRINKYLSLATDVKKKSPHVLRHTFATHMLNNGAGLEVLKELLGHANLSATQVYTHNSFAELTAIYSQSHPRGQQK
ncbi:MAG: tyrosine-type recombinase/integrase [Crocinitomicaceae bacterium]|nr:tyrosine-type recombinase/integrase [Flavobacteriales bacterium]NQZ37225.1 tyrosine-type recombinase/integrase [Crocinitomicaceae bacterium]